jgi:putative ABC transport system permease protein
VGTLAPDQGEELDKAAFLPLEPLLRLLGQRDGVREKTYYPQVVITIEDASRVDVRDLEETLVETLPGIQGTDDHWDPEAFKASYGGALAALDGWLVIITAVLVVMLVAGVSDTTLVAVTERRREIATLRAVGIPRGKVSRLVLTEVTLLVGAGLAAGLVIGSALAFLFGGLHETTGGSGVFLTPTSLDPMVLAAAALLALGSAVLAAAYPAYRAGGQRPTEALRYE